MKRKLLSVLVVFAMVLTLLPVTALADPVSGNITAEVTAAQEWGENTTVNASVTLKSTETSAFAITLSKDIDFGENTLTVTASDEQAVTISGGFSLKVNTVNVTAGKLILASNAKISGNIVLSTGATLCLTDQDYKAIDGSATVTCTDGSTVTLTNGKVQVPTSQAITIGDKTYTADGGAMTINSDTELTDGAVTLSDGASVKVSGKVISGDSVKISVSGGTATITGDSQTATIDGKTYTLGTSASLTYDGTDVTLTAGDVTLGSGASIKTSQTSAKVISGDGIKVAIGSGNVTISNDQKATIDGKEYTLSGTGSLTYDGTDVTLTAGSVQVQSGTAVKISTNTYTAAAADTKLKIDTTLEAGSVTLGASGSISVSGTTVSGQDVVVSNDGAVTVPAEKTATVGTNSYKCPEGGTEAKLTVASAEDVTLTAGTIELAANKNIKTSNTGNKAVGGDDQTATVTVDGGTTSIKSADSGGKIKIGDSTYTVDGTAATMTVTADGTPALTDGSIKMEATTPEFTVNGKTIAPATSGEDSAGVVVKSDGTIALAKDKAIKVDSTDIKNTSSDSHDATVKVEADGVKATLTNENDKLTVKGETPVTINDVTYTGAAGNGYDVIKGADDAGDKLTPTADQKVDVAFTGEADKSVTITDAAGDNSQTVKGKDGATITVTGSNSKPTVEAADGSTYDEKTGTVTKNPEPTKPSGGGSGSTTKSYKINTPAAENGRVYANPIQAVSGTKITLTVYPSSGYELYKLTVVTTKGGKEIATSGSGNTYTFTLPDSDVTVKALFAKPGEIPEEPDDEPETPAFVDVADSDYFADAVAWAVENGITDGIGNNLFAPQSSCTRAQIVTFLWRAAGSPEPASSSNPFADVNANDYYGKAVLWAVEQGITNGTSATEFAPNATCTRAQAVTFLHRYEK